MSVLLIEINLNTLNHLHNNDSLKMKLISETLQGVTNQVKKGYMGFVIRDANGRNVGSINIENRSGKLKY